MEWKEPPPLANSALDYKGIVDQLADNPGRWAQVASWPGVNKKNSDTAQNRRTSLLRAASKRQLLLEIKTRSEVDTTVLYARVPPAN